MSSSREKEASAEESEKAVRSVNVVQNSKEPASDAYLRGLTRKLAKGKGKMPMEESKISRGLAELDPIRVVVALPAAQTEVESGLEYKRNVAGTQRLLLEEEEAAIRKLKGSSVMPVSVAVLYAHWQRQSSIPWSQGADV